jgi:RNA polymerase sigma-70 factor (ECF subfamily)
MIDRVIPDTWNKINSDLRKFIFSRVHNDEDTDDIMQELYIKIHDNIGTLKDSVKIKSWIYKIAVNLVTDHFRLKEKERNKYAGKELYQPKESRKLMDIAIMDMIKFMNNLPDEYCEALCLTEIEGLSQKEYALKKGISYSAAKSRVQRARAMLRDLLMQCCHYSFDSYGTVIDIQPRCCCC